MSLINFLRDKLGIEGADLPLDRPKLSLKFLRNLFIYVLESRFHPVKLHYYPLTLMVEVSTACNLACSRCERQAAPKTFLGHHTSLDLIKKILPASQYAYSVYLVAGLGEGLLNRDFWKIHRLFKKTGVRVGFFTNGVLLNKSNIEKIFSEETDSVLISLDSAQKKIFEKIRRGANFEKIVDNIGELIQEKKRREAKKPAIGLSFTFQKDTIEEMPSFVEFAKKMGVDFISFAGVIAHRRDKVIESAFWIEEDKTREIFETTKGKAVELGLPIRMPKAGIDPRRYCEDLWRAMFIFYTGDVCPCPHYRCPKTYFFRVENGKIVQKETKTRGLALGNVFKESILDIWNNKNYCNLRRGMKENSAKSPCDKCYFRYGIH